MCCVSTYIVLRLAMLRGGRCYDGARDVVSSFVLSTKVFETRGPTA
jgi:hypothetical protein